jgi:uncharacterized Tic20 family protein
VSADASGLSRPSSASRTTAMMAHLSTLVGFFVSVPVAAGLVGPAIVWLTATQRGEPFAAGQAREALNFHLTVLLSAVLLLALPTPPTLMAVLVVAWMALVIGVAGLAYEGRAMRYPMALPLLRRRGGDRRR